MTKPTKTNLSKLVSQLGEARQTSSIAYEAYKKLKEEEDGLRAALYAELTLMNIRSAKGDDFTASIVAKPTVVVKDEKTVIKWLRDDPKVNEELYIGLKPTMFQTLAKSILSSSGEVIEGTELVVKENLSIRSNINKKEG